MGWHCACGRVNDDNWVFCADCTFARPGLDQSAVLPPPVFPEPHRASTPWLRTLLRRIVVRAVAVCLLGAAVAGGLSAWNAGKEALDKAQSGPPNRAPDRQRELLGPDGIERGMGGPSRADLAGPKTPAEKQLAAAIATPPPAFKLRIDRATTPETVVGNTDGTVRAYAKKWRDPRNRELLTAVVEFADANEATAYSGAARSQFATGIKGGLGVRYATQDGRQAAAIELHRGRLVAICVLITVNGAEPAEVAMLKAYATKQQVALR